MDQKKLEEGLELIVQFDKRGGLVPAIAQDYNTGEILIVGYANQKALDETFNSGYATFWSTSRNKLWKKGEEKSGDFLVIKEILIDCDQDALVYKVEKTGDGACHTRDPNNKLRRTCFYRRITNERTLEFLE